MVPISDVLKAIGPNAAIIFAASIFMGFLQQRYDGALGQYRAAVKEFRSDDHDKARNENLKDQVLSYQHRCKLMSIATAFGLVALVLLISSLLFSTLDVFVPKSSVVSACGTAAVVGGFILVIAAAVIVLVEGRVVSRLIDNELRDVPELAEGSGGSVGSNH